MSEFLQVAEIIRCEMQKFAAHVCTPDLQKLSSISPCFFAFLNGGNNDNIN